MVYKLIGLLMLSATCAFTLSTVGCEGKKDKVSSVTADPTTVKVKAGETKDVKITIKRMEGFKDAVVIKASGLPKGVTATDGSIAKDANDGKITLTAAGDAASATDQEITITAEGAKAKVKVTVEGTATTQGKGGDKPAVDVAAKDAIIKQNDTTKVDVRTKRTHLKEPVTVEFKGLPNGVTAEGDMKMTGDDWTTITLKAAKNAEVGEKTVKVNVTGPDTVKDTSASFKLTVQAAK